MDNKKVVKRRDIRRRHADEFKQALVLRSLVPGASVAAIAQEAGVNANLLFNWRRLHLQAQVPAALGESAPVFLPVTVIAGEPPAASPSSPQPSTGGTIEIELGAARVCVRGQVDQASLRVVLRTLADAA